MINTENVHSSFKSGFIYFTMLAVLMSILFFEAAKAQNEHLKAHYPLGSKYWNKNDNIYFKGEIYNEFDYYDISGNGRHGTLKGYTYDNENDFYVDQLEPFRGAIFPNILNDSEPYYLSETTCTHKTKREKDIYLKLPSTLGISGSNSLTISFWIYWDDGELYAGNTDRILTLPNLIIERQQGNLVIYTGSSTSHNYSVYSSGNAGWYNVVVTYDHNNKNLTVSKYILEHPHYFFDNNSSGNFTTVGSKTISTALSDFNSTSKIFDQNFDGYLWNVRFFDKLLTNTEMNAWLIEDMHWVENDINDNHPIASKSYHLYNFEGESSVFLHDKGVGANNGTGSGTINRVSDRFSRQNSAVSFSGSGSNISLNRFLKNYDFKNGFTISFWTKISDDYSTVPFTKEPFSASDIKGVYYANDNSNNTIFGLQRIKELIGMNRYSPLSNKDWIFWPYNPADFSAQTTGWFHVIVSYKANYHEIFIGKPSIDPMKKKCFIPWINYFGIHDQTRLISETLSWGLGSKVGHPIDILDDVRIYNWAMDYKDAYDLHVYESKSPNTPDVLSADWTIAEIIPGLEHKSAQFLNLFGGTQEVNLLDMNLSNPVELGVNYYRPPGSTLTRTQLLDKSKPLSHLAAQAGALAAVNSSSLVFGDYITAGLYLKKDGLLAEADPEVPLMQNEGVVLWDFDKLPGNQVKILERGYNSVDFFKKDIVKYYANGISVSSPMYYGKTYSLHYPDYYSNYTFNQNCEDSNADKTTKNYFSAKSYCQAAKSKSNRQASSFFATKGDHVILGAFSGGSNSGVSVDDYNVFKDAYGFDQLLPLDYGKTTTMWINGIDKMVVSTGNGNEPNPKNQSGVTSALLFKPELFTNEINDAPVSSSSHISLDGTNFIDLSKYYDQISGHSSGLIMLKYKYQGEEDHRNRILFSISKDTVGIADYEFARIATSYNSTSKHSFLTFKVKKRNSMVLSLNTNNISKLFDGNWHHISLLIPKRTSENIALFFDGVEQTLNYQTGNATSKYFTNIDATHAHLGIKIGNGNYLACMKGALDEVFISTDLSSLDQALQGKYSSNPGLSTLIAQSWLPGLKSSGYAMTEGIGVDKSFPAGSHYWQFEESGGYHAIDIAGEMNRPKDSNTGEKVDKGKTGWHGLLVNNPERVGTPNTTFAVIGDYGCKHANTKEAKVAQLVKSWNPDFILSVGDDNYNDLVNSDKCNCTCGATIQQNVGTYYGSYIDADYTKTNFYSVMGNHDYHSPSSHDDPSEVQKWLSYFKMPENTWITHVHPNVPDSKRRYYEYKRGDIHIIGLNSTKQAKAMFLDSLYWDANDKTKRSQEALWLKHTLENSTAKYKVVLSHVPVYSSTNRHFQLVRQYLRTIPFKEWGASIVLSGDDHIYERIVKDGFTYIINGLGGAADKGSGIDNQLNDVEGFIHYDDNWGAIKAVVYNEKMILKFININGGVVDEFIVYPSDQSLKNTEIKQPVNLDLTGLGFNQKMVVYPNPTSGKLTVKFNLPGSSQVAMDIFDMSGKLLFRKQEYFYAGENRINISDISAFTGLKSSACIIKLSGPHINETSKVIVE